MATITSNDEDLLELALFAGAGGGILGGKLLGWRTICAVERDAYAAQVLAQRQNDGILEAFPIWSDVQTFRAENPDCADMFAALRANAHRLVISGGFPCQDISVAGKGAGITGARSGLWKEFARIIGELQPRYAFIENSPRLTIRGLDVILCDLAKMGFNAEWGVLSAKDCGAVHLRERCWILAANARLMQCNGIANNWENCKSKISKLRNSASTIDDTNNRRKRTQGQQPKAIYRFTRFPWGEDVRRIADLQNRPDLPQPLIRRIGHDVACGMDRLKAIGNGQVPRCMATAFNLLKSRIENNLF